MLWALSPSAACCYLQNPLCLYLGAYKSRVHSSELRLHSLSNPHLKGRENRVQSNLVLYYYIQFFTSITYLLSISALYSQLHSSFLLVSFFAQVPLYLLRSVYLPFELQIQTSHLKSKLFPSYHWLQDVSQVFSQSLVSFPNFNLSDWISSLLFLKHSVLLLFLLLLLPICLWIYNSLCLVAFFPFIYLVNSYLFS